MTYDRLIEDMDRQQFAIISGIPGSGKSTSLRESHVRLNKTFYKWVIFVDLKQHGALLVTKTQTHLWTSQ
jgi:predicted ATPase